MVKTVQTLTEKMSNLKIKFDRAAYRASYDKVYFKKTVVCPRCGETKVKHKLKRHMKTKKCLTAPSRDVPIRSERT